MLKNNLHFRIISYLTNWTFHAEKHFPCSLINKKCLEIYDASC